MDIDVDYKEFLVEKTFKDNSFIELIRLLESIEYPMKYNYKSMRSSFWNDYF